MAKLVIYGSVPVLRTIETLYRSQLQSSELINENFVKQEIEEVVEQEPSEDETVSEESTPKKGKGKK